MTLYNEVIWPVWPIILATLLLVSVSCWTFITSRVRAWVKFLLIPSALLLSLLIPSFFVLQLGYSIFWPLPDEYEVFQHRVVIRDNKKKSIEIWLRELKGAVPSESTRLQRTPYSKELEKVLREAQQGRKAGKRSRLKREGKQSETDPNSSSQFKLHLDSPDVLAPKGAKPRSVPGREQGQPQEDGGEEDSFDRLPNAPKAGKFV